MKLVQQKNGAPSGAPDGAPSAGRRRLAPPLPGPLLQVGHRALPRPGGGVQLLGELAHLREVVHLVAHAVGLLHVPPAGVEEVGQELVLRRRGRDLLGEPHPVQPVLLPHRREVHLADGLPVVAPPAQQGREGGQLGTQAVAVVEDAAAVGEASAEQRGPGGDADRGLGVGPREAHPLAAEAVEVRRAQGRRLLPLPCAGASLTGADLTGAGRADGVRPVLVGHQQQDVGPAGLAAGGAAGAAGPAGTCRH